MADPQNGNNFGAVYTDKAQYDAAMAEWQRKKAAGDPFPGPMPRMDVPGQVEGALEQSNYPTELPNQQMWIDRTRAGANAAPNANPYSAIVANQARPAQEALYNQMRATQAGPSLAGMQGTKAQGQNLQAALGAGGGHPVMAQAGQIGAGVASDAAMGTLAEQLRMSRGIGNVAAGVRAADLGVANAESNTGLQQRGLDDAMRQFYATQGSALNNTIGRNELEAFKLRERLKLRAKKNDMAMVDAAASTGSTVAGGFM